MGLPVERCYQRGVDAVGADEPPLDFDHGFVVAVPLTVKQISLRIQNLRLLYPLSAASRSVAGVASITKTSSPSIVSEPTSA